MDVICLDEDDEIQQLQKELADLQKEREKYAKELKKRHLRNEIEKLRNENLQLKTKLIEHASQAHAEKDNDVKPVVEADISIKKQAGSQGSGQDKSIKKLAGSPGSGQDKGIKKLTESPGSGQDKSIKKPTGSPGNVQDNSIKKRTESPGIGRDNNIKKRTASPGIGQDNSIKKRTSSPGIGQDNSIKKRTESPGIGQDNSIKKRTESPGIGQDNSIKKRTESPGIGQDNSIKKRTESPGIGQDNSIKKRTESPGIGQDNSVKKRTASPGIGQDNSIKKHTESPGIGQDNSIKKHTESPGIGQDNNIKKHTASPGIGQDKHQNRNETGNKRPVGRPRKRPPSPDVAKKGLPEIGIEPGNMSISMNSKRVKLLPCQEDINDCEDNEDNFNTLRENYIWNKNGSPQYLCSLCDFTCEYYTAVYNHLRKEHNKASEAPNPKDKPGDKSKRFESGNLSKRLPTKTRSSSLQRASHYSVEERQKSSDIAVKQTFDHSHKEICRPSESAVKHISEKKQPSSSSAFRRIYDNSREERRKSNIAVRRTSDHSNEEIQKSSGSGVRQTSEEKQHSSGSAVRRTSNRMREERQKTSDRATAIKSEEAKGSKANTSIADLFKQISKGYECTVCQEVYHSYTVAYHHVIKHHAQPRYRCKYCAYEVYERHKLTKHCKIEHRGRKMAFIELGNEHQKNKSHTKEDGDSDIIIMAATAKNTDTGNKDPSDCESDDNNNTDSDDESEEKSDNDKSKSGSFKDKILKTSRGFKCGVCGHQTISYQGLYKHYVTNHKEKKESKFKCSFCRYTTNQRRYCIIHMKKAHTGKPVIYRSVGSVQKAHKTDVTAHASQQLTVTDYISRTAKGFKCTLCGNKTEEYHKTRYHVYYQHFAVFVCPYCEYKSSNRPQVVAHGKKFHPGKPLKITWHVKGKTRQNNLSIKFGDAKEKRKKNNSSDETGNKRPVGRPRKILSSPCVAKKSLPEINREPGYMSISMNSKRVKLLPCQEDIKDKKHHLNKEVSIKANDEVSIKMEPNDLEQSDVRLLPNVYIDKDELYEFVPQVNEPVIDGPLGEQEMPILSSTTFEEDPVPVSSTTVDVTPDEVDGVRDDVTPDEVDGVRDDVTPDKVDEAREDVTPDKVDMAIDVTPDKLDIAREDATPDKVDMARDDVTPDKVDIAREDGAEDHPAEKSDREKGNTAETGELDLEMEVESFETEHGKKPSDSKHGNTEKKKDDGEDSDDILSPRMCMHIDQNEVWEIRVDELQAQPGVQSELHQAKIKIENEEEEAAGI